MFIGQYTTWFDTAISPWTTLGPLAVVISVSLLVEGFSDYKRHQNDHETNNAKCVILRRADELEAEKADSKKKQPYPIERDEHICKGKDVAVDMNKMYAIDGLIEPPASNSNGERSSSNGTRKQHGQCCLSDTPSQRHSTGTLRLDQKSRNGTGGRGALGEQQ